MTSDPTTQAAPPRLYFSVAPEPALLLRARDRIRDYLRQFCAEPRVIDDVVLCVEEAATNAIRHSGSDDDIEISLRFADGDLLAEVRDHGQGFDLASFDREGLPDVMADHGRGLFIVANLMDSLKLSLDGGLEVRMARRAEARCKPSTPEGIPFETRGGGDLGEHESRGRALLDETDEFVMVIDWEYRYAHLNEAAQRFLRRSREELIGRCIWEVVPALADTAEGKALREAVELGRFSMLEYQTEISGDWIEARFYPTSSGVSVFGHEINERKRREQERDELVAALQESQIKLETALAAITDGFYTLDRTWHVTYLNESAAAVFPGGKAALGADFWQLFPEAAGSDFETNKRAAMEQGEFRTFESYYPPFDTWFEERDYPGGGGITVVFNDITERKRGEQRLRESQELLQAVIDGSPDPIFVKDQESRILLGNAALLEVWGKPAEEVVGKNDRELYEDPAVGDAIIENDRAVIQSGQSQAIEEVVQTPGGLRTYLSTKSPYRDGEGEIVGVLGIARDISDRKRVEEALRDSEQRFRALFENGLDAVFLARPDGTIEAANPAACAMYGYSEDELRALGRAGIIDEDDPRVTARLPEWTRAGHLRGGQLTGIRKGGERFPVEADSVTLPSEPKRYFVVHRDITERTRVEHEQQEALVFTGATARIDELLHLSLDAEEIIARALEEGGKALGAETASVMPRERGAFVARYIWNWPPEALGTVVPEQKDAHGLLALEAREPVAIDDTSTDARVHRGHMDDWSIKSVLAVPLFVRGEAYAVAYFDHITQTHHFTRSEIAFAARLGASLSAALENARLYEEQQRIAETLQENFTHELPEVAGLELGEVSQTSFAAELVGGDFSDVFVLDDDRVVLLIGDVAGKGVRAAGYTVTVRSKVRAFAWIDSSPAFILGKANELMMNLDPDEPHVTAFCAVLDPHTGHLSYASAGHPAPIHVGPFMARPLEVAFGPPLGSFVHAYGESHATLTPDDYLVFYTDGVTEARRDGKMYGEARLVATVADLRGTSAQELAEGLLKEVGNYADRLADDIQIVTLRLA